MVVDASARLVAFEGNRRLIEGDVVEVAVAAHRSLSEGSALPVLVFDATTSSRVDLELRGTEGDVRRRYSSAPFVREANPPAPDKDSATKKALLEKVRPRGRPRLGVVSREVTLLPRHWEWLAARPGGASVTLRKLVDQARLESAPADALRHARESAYRFMSAMAGDATGFEEASRALFAGNRDAFLRETEAWPADVREHARTLADRTWASAATPNG